LANDAATPPAVKEEMWVFSLPIPMLAYVARPLGDGPFPLVVMNHGESSDATARGLFPKVEFKDAALWFARRGYFVVSHSDLENRSEGKVGDSRPSAIDSHCNTLPR
jgi:dienelactone hydrolase